MTPMVIGSLTPRTPTCSGKGQSSATMLSSTRTGGSSSTLGATVRKRLFKTVFEQDAPSYSIHACRPTTVANLSSTINVNLFLAIIERVEILEVHVPSLEAEVKSQKAIIRDLHTQIAASSKAPATPAYQALSIAYPLPVHVYKPTIIVPPPPQPSTAIPSKPKVAIKLTVAQSYAMATSLYLPPPPPPPPMWKVHQLKQQKKQKQHEESPFAPAKSLPIEARRIVFSRDPSIKASPKLDQEFMAAINNCLYLKDAPQFHRVAKVARNTKGTITATTIPGVDATMLLHLYRNKILNAIWEVDRGVADVKELDNWVRLKVHGLPLNRFMGRGTQGVQKLQLEIQANHEGVEVLPGIRWLGKAG
jgi:hypothetical protein